MFVINWCFNKTQIALKLKNFYETQNYIHKMGERKNLIGIREKVKAGKYGGK